MHFAPYIGKKVRFLIIENKELTPAIIHNFKLKSFINGNAINTITMVQTEFINKNNDEFLTLFVTVNIFHNPSNGRQNIIPADVNIDNKYIKL